LFLHMLLMSKKLDVASFLKFVIEDFYVNELMRFYGFKKYMILFYFIVVYIIQ